MDISVTDQISNAMIEGLGYTAIVTAEMPDGHFVEVMSVSPERGFEGALLVRRQGTPLEQVIEAYLNRDDREYDAPDVKIARDGVNEAILACVLSGRAVKGQIQDETAKTLMRTMKSMMRKHMTPEAFDLLRVMPSIGPHKGLNKTSTQAMGPNLTLLTQGDQNARVQAIRSNYGLLGLIMENSGLRDLIDGRRPINKFIKDHDNLDKDQFLALRKMFRSASTNISDTIDEPEGNIERKRSQLIDTDNMVKMARFLRPDQVPGYWRDLLIMSHEIDNLKRFADKTGLGDLFVQRTLKPILKDYWDVASREAKIGNYEYAGGVTDYLKVTTGVMASAVVMDAFLSNDREMLAGVAQAASDLLSHKDVSEEVLDRLSSVTSLLDRSDIKDLREAVQSEIKMAFGRSSSLKELRERSTRWHHINQLLSSAVTSEGVDITWVPLAGEVEVNGCRAVEMSSSTRLAEQGVKENHCVGSYVSVILNPPYSGARALFSIEDDEGVLSTVEVEISQSYDDRGRGYYAARSIQHQAHSNTEPGLKAVTAVKGLIGILNDMSQEDLSGYVKEIKQNPHSLRQKVGQQITLWGGNIFSDGFSSLGLETYQEVIPRRLRGGIQDVNDLISLDLQARIDDTVRAALAGEDPKQAQMRQSARELNERLGDLLGKRSPRPDSTAWIGVVLADLDIQEFEVTLSGSGDSGDIDDYDFRRDGEGADDVLASLDKLYLPGTAVSLRDRLDRMVDMDACSEGNWYDNDGGNVWSKYVINEGHLVADVIILTHNEPDEEDEEELDDEFEDIVAP